MRTTDEVWRPVVGWEGIYCVSNIGRVRRERPGLRQPLDKPALRKTTSGTDRYPRVRLRDVGSGRKQKLALVHVLVAEAFLGPRGNLTVNHKDGDKGNNRLENLEYMTLSENARHGRWVLKKQLGAAHPQARLNPEAVRLIRQMLMAGCSRPTIARKFGVSTSAIQRIDERSSWTHVT